LNSKSIIREIKETRIRILIIEDVEFLWSRDIVLKMRKSSALIAKEAR